MGTAPSRRADGGSIAAAARSLALDAATARTCRIFTEHGIPNVLLKGPVIARWLYQDAGPRRYGDSDFLVSPSSFPKAEALLRTLGYVEAHLLSPDGRPHHAHQWARPDHTVDLHQTLPGVKSPPESAWEVLSRHTETMTVANLTLDVLDPPARLMHIVLHAAHHGIAMTKPLEDLELALAQVEPSLWHDGAQIAEELDALPAFVSGLRLSPAASPVLAELGIAASPCTEALLRAAGSPPLSLGLDWLIAVPGTTSKFRYLRGKLCPDRSSMKSWSPLACSGTLGLVAAYLWRPIYLFLKLPGGMAAWLWARNASRKLQVQARKP